MLYLVLYRYLVFIYSSLWCLTISVNPLWYQNIQYCAILVICIHVHYANHLGTFIDYVIWRTKVESTTRYRYAWASPKDDADERTWRWIIWRMSRQKMVVKRTSSNNTNLVLSKQAPVHLPPPSVLKSFITLNDALGDRSCVIKQLMHFLPWLNNPNNRFMKI